ncbi:MAG: hypothetical protein CFH43_00800, partial [Proteobacteria bacterium]
MFSVFDMLVSANKDFGLHFRKVESFVGVILPFISIFAFISYLSNRFWSSDGFFTFNFFVIYFYCYMSAMVARVVVYDVIFNNPLEDICIYDFKKDIIAGLWGFSFFVLPFMSCIIFRLVFPLNDSLFLISFVFLFVFTFMYSFKIICVYVGKDISFKSMELILKGNKIKVFLYFILSILLALILLMGLTSLFGDWFWVELFVGGCVYLYLM